MPEPLAERPLRVGVVGVGHLGRHHARIYRDLEKSGSEAGGLGLVQLVRVIDRDAAAAERVAADLGVPHGSDLQQLLDEGVDAVSIVVPTVAHLAAAEPFLERGIACLVEKPIAVTLEEADRMIAVAAEHGALLQVGHVERFNPAFEALVAQQRLPLFIEAHRLAPFTFRSTDVGVVQDLMIHDLDLVLAMVRAPLERVDAVGGRIFTRSEDVVSARLGFAGGAAANVTASRVSIKPMRRFRVFSEDSYLSLDLGERHALMVTKGPSWDARAIDPRAVDPELMNDRDRLREFVFNGLLSVQEFRFEAREPLREELRAFLRCVREGTPPRVSGADGRAALETAVRIVESLAGSLAARARAENAR
ncbi:MAG: Gfo/Idh/MocA family oxidoreductase [Planctomycetes bacterium]|nr:Gfo/Idh/MocA family oxidoreductase [Planctomycetota bacterium]